MTLYVENSAPAVYEQMTAIRNALVSGRAYRQEKGREWESVRIGSDFKAPVPGEDVDRAEAMLSYVAVTRAKLRLDCTQLQAPTPG